MRKRVRQEGGWGLNRREFLAAGAALVAAACGATASSSDSTSTNSHPDPVIEPGLRIASRPASVNPASVAGFQSVHPGVAVSQSSYASNGQLLGQLAAAKGQPAFDVIVPDADHVAIERSLGLLKPLNHDLIPNLRYLERHWTQLSYDPGNAYSVIKDAGITGFTLRTDRVRADLRTWQDFFGFLPHASGLAVNFIDSAAQMVGFALISLGYSMNTVDDGQLNQAEQLLMKVRPFVTSIDPQYRSSFEAGGIDLGVTTSGDGIAIRTARAGLNDIRVVAPEGRSELWIDNWCISASAPDPVAAHAWINYILDPRHDALEMRYTGYEVGTPGSFPLVGAAASDPLVVFGPSVLNTYEILRTTPDGLQKRIAIWERFKEGLAT
jgi:spermidine/putrescine transport system substrate-binding protein